MRSNIQRPDAVNGELHGIDAVVPQEVTAKIAAIVPAIDDERQTVQLRRAEALHQAQMHQAETMSSHKSQSHRFPNTVPANTMMAPCSGGGRLPRFRDLRILGSYFRCLQFQLNDILSKMAASPDINRDLEEREDQIRSTLYELAWTIAEERAATLAELKIKACVMEDRCCEKHSDIIVALARSISRDIHDLAEQM